MNHIVSIRVLCVALTFLCSQISSMPTTFAIAREQEPVEKVPLIAEDNISSVRKRSTNADIGLHGSRSSRMQDLLRRYMLLTILENVKGKRSIPKKTDGSVDYERIAGVVMANEASRKPWYVVDMKRDIHQPTNKVIPSLRVPYFNPGDLEISDGEAIDETRNWGDIRKEMLEHDIEALEQSTPTSNDDLELPPSILASLVAAHESTKSRQSPFHLPSELLWELPKDEDSGNSEFDLLKLLSM